MINFFTPHWLQMLGAMVGALLKKMYERRSDSSVHIDCNVTVAADDTALRAAEVNPVVPELDSDSVAVAAAAPSAPGSPGVPLLPYQPGAPGDPALLLPPVP